MQPTSPQDDSSIRAAHPLALLLIERAPKAGIVLDFATGSGRNAAALVRAGLRVLAVDDATAESDAPLATIAVPLFDAALSTHGFLHGTARDAQRRVAAVASRLTAGAPLYATFGSRRDRRFGEGTRIDAHTFAPVDGDERGVAHVYFDESALRAVLEPHFTIESLEERDVDGIAGSWAHRERPLQRAVHWFAVALRRSAG